MSGPQKLFLIILALSLVSVTVSATERQHQADLGRALYALGEQRNPNSFGVLAAGLNHDNPHIRRIAAHALGKLGHPGALPALARLATDRDQPLMVRRVVWRAMSRLGDPMARQIIERRSVEHQVALSKEALAGLE